jgi:protein tyrosine phosphatase (PTP) superfamily phosphohydrolase (DUF442 family)
MKITLLAVLLAAASPAAAGTLEAAKGSDPFEALNLATELAPHGQGLVFRAAAKPAQSLPNFSKVSPVLYRSGQPTQAGVDKLSAMGVKTILKLNADDPAEADWAAGDGVTLVGQLLDNHRSPSFAQVDAALAVLADPARQPVLVHCHRGADRTGAVVAAYRVVYGGMSVADAVAEAKSFGYGAPGFDDLTAWLQSYLAQRPAK